MLCSFNLVRRIAASIGRGSVSRLDGAAAGNVLLHLQRWKRLGARLENGYGLHLSKIDGTSTNIMALHDEHGMPALQSTASSSSSPWSPPSPLINSKGDNDSENEDNDDPQASTDGENGDDGNRWRRKLQHGGMYSHSFGLLKVGLSLLKLGLLVSCSLSLLKLGVLVSSSLVHNRNVTTLAIVTALATSMAVTIKNTV